MALGDLAAVLEEAAGDRWGREREKEWEVNRRVRNRETEGREGGNLEEQPSLAPEGLEEGQAGGALKCSLAWCPHGRL